MDLGTLIKRSKRGMQENKKIYLVSIVSLSVAFLCLATSLLAIGNLSKMAHQWSQSNRMTIFLRDGSRTDDVRQLQLALQSMSEFSAVHYLSSDDAKTQFLKDAELDSVLASVPADAFPASLEIRIAEGIDKSRIRNLSEHIKEFPAAEDVETYAAWFGPMQALLSTAHTAATLLALLVALCVIAVVANTIRLAVSNRSDEIRVLKLCGATNSYIRSPFLVEGAVQGLASAGIALLCLSLIFLLMRPQIDAALTVFTGMRASFLGLGSGLMLIGLGLLMGSLGSFVSVHRYLRENP
ncbi:MAG: hypothetical protein IPJ88_09265 [Myxococcales bacterium]|nr:MAG: hypothetical protein IPJ88_09265 [Myxococcales bacterium]